MSPDEVDGEVERGSDVPIDLRHAHVPPDRPTMKHVGKLDDLERRVSFAQGLARQSPFLRLGRIVSRREKHLKESSIKVSLH